MPPKIEDGTKETHERDVLEVSINNNDEILLESEYASIADVRRGTREFMCNTGVFDELLGSEDYPQRKWVLKDELTAQILDFKSRGTLDSKEKIALKKKKKQLEAVDLLGDYRELPDNAVIYVSCQDAVTYQRYIEIVNEIEVSCNELREELCLEKFNRNYTDLDKKIPEDRLIYKAIKRVYPGRVAENLDE